MMRGNPIAPWHMWGTSEVLDIETTGASEGRADRQLARIDYKRPDTWRFLFAARLVDAVNPNPIACTITVDFVLLLGLGRSNLQVDDRNALPGVPLRYPGFCRFVFNFTGPPPLPIGQLKWTSAVPSPLLDDTVATSSVLVNEFVAESITCSARLSIDSRPSPSSARLELHSFFAPNVHVRPEWWDDANMFRGNETGGT